MFGANIPHLVIYLDPPMVYDEEGELPSVPDLDGVRRVEVMPLKMHLQHLLLSIIAVGVASTARMRSGRRLLRSVGH